jgi:hypothetical protein
MAVNTPFVLAGIAGTGTSGAELVWFGQSGGVVAPTNATTALTTTVTNEVQTVTITGTPTGGTFTLTFRGQTTSAIAYNATSSTVVTALEALSTIGAGNVTATGGAFPGTAVVVTFTGTLAGQNVPLMTASGTGLTGGTNPAVSVAETTAGASGWQSAGLISEDGAAIDVKESAKEVRSFGLQVPIRKIVTSSDITIKCTMQETNKVTTAIYRRLPLNSVTVTGGAFSVTEGVFRAERYAMCIDAVDGLNKVRVYAPNVEVTDRDGMSIKNGEVIQYGVSLTAYPDSTGVSTYTYHVVNGLT